MANKKHLQILRKGVEKWNRWRCENPGVVPDLTDAELVDADLEGILLDRGDLRSVNLQGAKLNGASLRDATLMGAVLNDASLSEANLHNTNLSYSHIVATDFQFAELSRANLYLANGVGASLRWANLMGANLNKASFEKADLRDANLSGSVLVETNLNNATLRNCKVYGCAAWNVRLEGTDQKDLMIWKANFDEFCIGEGVKSPDDRDKLNLYALKDELPLDYLQQLDELLDEPVITVDNLILAQFIYLLLNNEMIRDVIDTITSKAVLILGRFTKERKAVLDALRQALRERNYLPMLFDFEKPKSRNLTETISTLAHMSRFVIADLTDARSIPQELQSIVPSNPSLPIQPIVIGTQKEYGMFESFRDYHSVLAPYHYQSLEKLLKSLEAKVIAPAERKVKEIERHRRAFEKSAYAQ